MAGYQSIHSGQTIDSAITEVGNTSNSVTARKSGTGAPTASTAGRVGDMYTDETNGNIYHCTAANGGVYTWELLGATETDTTLLISGRAADAAAVGEALHNIVSDAWDITRTYQKNDLCLYDNIAWLCNIPNSGQQPSEGVYWHQITLVDLIKKLSVKVQRVEVTTTTNTSVTPFGAYCEVNIANTPVPNDAIIITAIGYGTSGNAIVIKRSDVRNSFLIYSHQQETFNVDISYI